MNWGAVEKSFVAVLKVLERPDGHKYAERCDQYNGEFQSPWALPEDFNPQKRYALVQFQSGSASSAGKMSQNDMSISAQLSIFVGSQSAASTVSKSDVYEMLDVFQKALHSATAELDGTLIKVLWASDALEFSEPNHICFQQVYNVRIEHYRVDNGKVN